MQVKVPYILKYLELISRFCLCLLSISESWLPIWQVVLHPFSTGPFLFYEKIAPNPIVL